MRRIAKRLKYRSLLLFLVLYASSVALFHHHDDFKVHDDCPICIVSHFYVSDDAVSIPNLPPVLLQFFADFPAVVARIVSTVFQGCHSRAPPVPASLHHT